MRAGVATHAVPAYVPAARGRITHDVVFSHPCRPEEEPVFDSVPCLNLAEASAVVAAKQAIGITDIRIVRRDGVA